MKDEKSDKSDAKRTSPGPLGSHPASTGLGAVAGGIAGGAVVGSVAGPIGTIAGAATGAVLGGVSGRKLGEVIDPTVEDAHWKSAYAKESYYQSGMTYDDYAPAYRVGYQGRSRYAGRKFDDVQGSLEADYNRTKASSKLNWDKAKNATRAAWNRIEKAMPGDLDRDGK